MSFLKRLFPHKIDNTGWEGYSTQDEDEKFVFVSFDQNYIDIDKRKKFKGELFTRVNLPEDKQFEGIPIPPEQHYQSEKEEELRDALVGNRVHCMQVGRITADGQKHYIFEYNDLDGFRRVYNKWKNTFNEAYEIDLILLPTWEYYDEILPDKYNWQQIGNRHLIERLIEVGSNPEKEHYIEHAIFGEKRDLVNLYYELERHDGIQLIGLEDDMLEIGIHSILDLDEISNQTYFLIQTSDKYNCLYDGWQTAHVN